MSLMVSNEAKPRQTFDSAEMGAFAHLYRGEVYRSTIWRTRLDRTTNWSIVTMGIAAPVIDRSRSIARGSGRDGWPDIAIAWPGVRVWNRQFRSCVMPM